MNVCKTLLVVLMLSAGQQTATAKISEQEIERREAAAGFLLPMAMSLGVLRLECSQWLKGDEDIHQVAREWWERNRESLDAAIWVGMQSVRRYRATMLAEQASLAERRMAQATGDAALAILRTTFASQLPTPQLCQKAMQQYKRKELDIANLSRAPGYERFGEFGETLRLVLADKDYRPMNNKFRTFDAQVPIGRAPLISVDAIEAAKSRKDAAGVIRAFESLAERGDSRAVQTLGVYYLNGQYVSRSPKTAYGWFYNAWAMGNPEGINALGVLWRDSVEVTADPRLALVSFAVAKQMAARGAVEALQRATSNYSGLSQKMTPAEISEAGCTSWKDFHSRIRQIAETSGVALLPPPTLPHGNFFDTNTWDRKQLEKTSCGS